MNEQGFSLKKNIKNRFVFPRSMTKNAIKEVETVGLSLPGFKGQLLKLYA